MKNVRCNQKSDKRVWTKQLNYCNHTGAKQNTKVTTMRRSEGLTLQQSEGFDMFLLGTLVYFGSSIHCFQEASIVCPKGTNYCYYYHKTTIHFSPQCTLPCETTKQFDWHDWLTHDKPQTQEWTTYRPLSSLPQATCVCEVKCLPHVWGCMFEYVNVVVSLNEFVWLRGSRILQ